MKKNLNLPALFVLILLSAGAISAQGSRQNILEDTNLQFFLEAEPNALEAGFADPQSTWQMRYEIYLTDYSELIKIGICAKDKNRVLECDPIEGEKSKNRIRKISKEIIKGGFAKKNLLDETNREEKVKIKLPPDVVQTFNQAAADTSRNPTFVLFITGKISVKNSDNQKLKESYALSSIKKLKTGSSRKDFEYWDVRRMYLTIRVIKNEDGRLSLSRGFVQ